MFLLFYWSSGGAWSMDTEQSVKRELHIFWTSGVSDSSSAYIEDRSFPIGGQNIAYLVPFAIESLLDERNDFILRIIVDDLVLAAKENHEILVKLPLKFPGRIQITKIDELKKNLTTMLISLGIEDEYPGSLALLNKLLEQATKGNPSIASDIYRIFGVYYGYPRNTDSLDKKIISYGDIIVKNILISEQSKLEFINNLFQDSMEEKLLFYVHGYHGLPATEIMNDVLKVEFSQPEQYRNFFCYCLNILQNSLDGNLSMVIFLSELITIADEFSNEQKINSLYLYNNLKNRRLFRAWSPMVIIEQTGPGVSTNIVNKYLYEKDMFLIKQFFSHAASEQTWAPDYRAWNYFLQLREDCYDLVGNLHELHIMISDAIFLRKLGNQHIFLDEIRSQIRTAFLSNKYTMEALFDPDLLTPTDLALNEPELEWIMPYLIELEDALIKAGIKD